MPEDARDSAEERVIERTAQRFARALRRRSTYHYVASKLRRDPATRAIVRLGPLREVLDLGCGRGHLALYLLESGIAESVRAFDWDEDKIALARDASQGLAASFETRDIRHVDMEPADTVLLVDVLHYLRAPTQDAMLERAADLVRPGGKLVVRDATMNAGWRSFVTLVVEWISVLVRFNVGERITLRNVARDVVPVLEAKGLTCTIEPCWRGTPFANVLVIGTRPAAIADAVATVVPVSSVRA
jgi:2-polyprenyl-3-methyl-5-hydroxy-6-metoxy-1,4-benzoquinol methylase